MTINTLTKRCLGQIIFQQTREIEVHLHSKNFEEECAQDTHRHMLTLCMCKTISTQNNLRVPHRFEYFSSHSHVNMYNKSKMFDYVLVSCKHVAVSQMQNIKNTKTMIIVNFIVSNINTGCIKK
jgi:hypothetical protein